MAAGAPFIIPIPPIAARSLFVSECSLLESASPAGCLRRGGQLMAGQTGPRAIFPLLLFVFPLPFILTAAELRQSPPQFLLAVAPWARCSPTEARRSPSPVSSHPSPPSPRLASWATSTGARGARAGTSRSGSPPSRSERAPRRRLHERSRRRRQGDSPRAGVP